MRDLVNEEMTPSLANCSASTTFSDDDNELSGAISRRGLPKEMDRVKGPARIDKNHRYAKYNSGRTLRSPIVLD